MGAVCVCMWVCSQSSLGVCVHVYIHRVAWGVCVCVCVCVCARVFTEQHGGCVCVWYVYVFIKTGLPSFLIWEFPICPMLT